MLHTILLILLGAYLGGLMILVMVYYAANRMNRLSGLGGEDFSSTFLDPFSLSFACRYATKYGWKSVFAGLAIFVLHPLYFLLLIVVAIVYECGWRPRSTVQS